MRPTGLNELRELFLSFFEGKGHLRLPSFPLIPKNDKSLLLINSGMAPLKPYFTGAAKPPRARVATCQKCIRTPDIDNVGYTSRHGTFFEMLGNFSFGDYFKRESIAWGWEFFTQVLEIPEALLYASVYLEDGESYNIWRDEIGIDESHIVRLGKGDNFWEHGLGPCGPCSEIYFDRGEANGCGKPGCAPGCDCDRYVEVWNHVFTQFDRKADGSYDRLAATNIDTGMGLERLACVMQGTGSIFEVDTIKALLDAVCALAGIRYNAEYKSDVSARIITDHIRSSAMMVADGVIPSNEGRGYVLRRLLRRAARHGRLLGIEGNFLDGLSEKVAEISGKAYPELAEKSGYVKRVISNEEERFAQTLDQGLAIFRENLEAAKKAGAAAIGGDAAFKLHDTYGFPLDLTREIAREEGMGVDADGFAALMEGQRAKARAALKLKDSQAWAKAALEGLEKMAPTAFTGYGECRTETVVAGLYSADGAAVQSAGEGENITALLASTPFYAESGGQVSDVGSITTPGGEINVFDCEKTDNGVYLHHGEVVSGTVAAGEAAEAAIDAARRADTAKNHTATHLLQSALRKVLGDHVNQSGSFVGPDRLRFDFNHFEQAGQERLGEIERLVNDGIFAALPVTAAEMSLDDAKAAGARALFGEKYGDTVRVVSAGDISKELCGGTHVSNTANIGMFTILSEGGIAAGIRRIEAQTGAAAYGALKRAERILSDSAAELKCAPEELPGRIESLRAEIREAGREIERLTDLLVSGYAGDALASAGNIGACKFIARRYDLLDAEGLAKLADAVRGREPSAIAALASGRDGKVSFVAAAGKDALAAGADAGKIVKAAAAAAGGGGGGRKDLARAGGRDPSLIPAALEAAREAVASQLSASK